MTLRPFLLLPLLALAACGGPAGPAPLSEADVDRGIADFCDARYQGEDVLDGDTELLSACRAAMGQCGVVEYEPVAEGSEINGIPTLPANTAAAFDAAGLPGEDSSFGCEAAIRLRTEGKLTEAG